jgi:hypothetical protein
VHPQWRGLTTITKSPGLMSLIVAPDRLKRIDPLSELEGEKREETVSA